MNAVLAPAKVETTVEKTGRVYDIQQMDKALKAERFTMPQGLTREERRRLILESAK